MTKIAFISDLHACLDALDNVLADCRRRRVDQVFCLGDVVDMGPEPAAVIERLIEHQIPTVRGNHDTLDEQSSIAFLRDLEDWTRAQLSSDALRWLAELPFLRTEYIEHLRLLLVHGSPVSNTQGLLAETPTESIDGWLSEASANIMLAGHTHVPLIRYVKNGMAVNVGSTSMPFAEANVIPPVSLNYSDYVVIEVEQGQVGVEQIRLPLDVDALRRAVVASDMPYQATFLAAYD